MADGRHPRHNETQTPTTASRFQLQKVSGKILTVKESKCRIDSSIGEQLVGNGSFSLPTSYLKYQPLLVADWLENEILLLGEV